MKNYSEALNAARNLKKDASTPIYQDLRGGPINRRGHITLYVENPTPYSVFMAMTRTSRCYADGGYYYTITIPVRASNGNTLPKSEWRKVVMYHKKWARKDIEVNDVKFDIVGLKRESTHLPAGVVVNNIKFITE